MSSPFELNTFSTSVLLRLCEQLQIPIQEASLLFPFKVSAQALVSSQEVEEALSANGYWEKNAPSDEMRRALRALGMPRKQYDIKMKNMDGQIRFFAFGNSSDVVVAALGNDEVGFARPITFLQFLGNMMSQVGHDPIPSDDFHVLRVNTPTFALICHFIEKGMASEPLAFDVIEPKVASFFPEKEQSQLFMQALVDDQVLVFVAGKYEFALGFKGWVKALQSGCQMQVERTDLRGGKVSDAPTKEKAAFFGPVGERYSMLETADGSGDLLLCRPGRKQLRSLMGALLGEADNSNLAFHMPRLRR